MASTIYCNESGSGLLLIQINMVLTIPVDYMIKKNKIFIMGDSMTEGMLRKMKNIASFMRS